jgi:hypothetical protein
MTSDLVKLHDKVKQVAGVLGSVHSPETLSHWMETMTKQVKSLEDFKNVAGVKFATLISNQNSFKDELNNTMEEVAELQASVQHVQGWTVGAEQTLEVFKRRFTVIRPFINRLSSSSPENDNLSESSFASLQRKLMAMEEKIKILENRVVGVESNLETVCFSPLRICISGCRLRYLRDVLVYLSMAIPSWSFLPCQDTLILKLVQWHSVIL